MTDNMKSTESAGRSGNALKTLGLAARSGKLVYGCDACCDALKSGRSLLIIMASGISQNTSKRLSDRCAFYGARLIQAECGADELGQALGRRTGVAAAAVTDKSLAGAVASAFDKQQ